MLLNSPTLFLSRRTPWKRTFCLASSTANSSDNLRDQLDKLHSEAQISQNKAKNARLRLLRLSDAAEKLRRQAAISVQAGREDDAREVLIQKKKVMYALEKSKSRIELLDKLCAKLNEAISAKETQLIGSVSSDFKLETEEASSPVRVVPTNQEFTSNESGNYNEDCPIIDDEDDLRVGEDQKSQLPNERQASPEIHCESNSIDRLANVGDWNGANLVATVDGISCYEDFLKYVDSQLEKIETEVVTMLRISTVTSENEEKPKKSKVQKTLDILEDVRKTRARIASIMETEVQIYI